MKTPKRPLCGAALASALAIIGSGHAQTVEPPPGEAIIRQLKDEAEALRPLVTTEVARCFLDAAAALPVPGPRTVLLDPATRTWFAPGAAPPGATGLEQRELGPETYYLTRYGSPLAYCRAVELVARAGLGSLEGRRVLDFGYGTVGHLRMMASCGADVVGVDVDSFLTALYRAAADQGVVTNARGRDGSVRLVDGRWPADDPVRSAIGGSYDVFVSKNTLKRGYVHPEREVDPRRLVHLGVDDDAYVRALFAALRPGGLAIIYNLAPAQNPPDQPYLPWADGRCPFSRALLESAGFEVLAFDVDDTTAAHAQARALGWDRPGAEGGAGMDLERDLFAHYTLLRKPAP